MQLDGRLPPRHVETAKQRFSDITGCTAKWARGSTQVINPWPLGEEKWRRKKARKIRDLPWGSLCHGTALGADLTRKGACIAWLHQKAVFKHYPHQPLKRLTTALMNPCLQFPAFQHPSKRKSRGTKSQSSAQ